MCNGIWILGVTDDFKRVTVVVLLPQMFLCNIVT